MHAAKTKSKQAEPLPDVADPDLKPRSVRKRKRPADELGLGSGDELNEFAEAFIKLRHQHFPELFKHDLEEAIGDSMIGAMIEDLKKRHGTGVLTGFDEQIVASGVAYAVATCVFQTPTAVPFYHGPAA